MKKIFFFLLAVIGAIYTTQAQNVKLDSIPRYFITVNKKNGEELKSVYYKGLNSQSIYPFEFSNNIDTFFLYNYGENINVDSIDNIIIKFADYFVKEVSLPTKILADTYLEEPNEDNVTAAIEALQNEGMFNYSMAGQYCLRGGKEENVPTSYGYQKQYNFGPDIYSQYFTIPHKDFMFFTNEFTSTYDYSDEYISFPHNAYYYAKEYFMHILQHPSIDIIPEIKAINLLYYCIAAQEKADLSGPFSYTADKIREYNNSTPAEIDEVKTIYYGIVEDLDNIVLCLKNYENRPDWYKNKIGRILSKHHHTAYESLYGKKTVIPYIKLANSLKLRMAMHIVKVEPETAKKWAEEAVESGVIESIEEQSGIFPIISGFNHPLIEIQAWGDLCLSASFESLLMSLNHPYTKYLFLPNSNPITNRETNEVLQANSRICGIRSGAMVGNGQTYSDNQYQAYSKIDNNILRRTMPPLYLIKWAEVDFLRAEGAIRGWNMGGEAKEFYERGIRNAYIEDPMNINNSQYANLIDEYIELEKAVDYVNIDPIGDGEPWQSVTKIGVKWNDTDDNERKLEKIITQKYIALFPLSTEAWTEMRRTGYPKMFPVLNANDGDGSIKQGDMIRRIPWYINMFEYDITYMKYFSFTILGGANTQAQRLWWDVDVPNF